MLSWRASTRGAQQIAALFALLYCALGMGCAQHTRLCMPCNLLTSKQHIDLNATDEIDYSQDREAMRAALARVKAAQGEPDPDIKKYHVLALSGGGSYGAFSAGILNGWTASGERPCFDIVSGVSTGALIATYAFLGPDYDDELREFYTTTTTDDIYEKRFKPAVLWSESYVKSEPLQQLIEKNITPQLLCKVQIGHAEGRRLFIGTTNLDTGRLVIWDMGAIASSGKPDSLALFRQVILASASPPGFFPPVPIEVTVNDQVYTELHVDGGTTAQVFFRSSMIPIDRAKLSEGRRPLAGSRVYVVIAGKAFPDPQCVESRVLKIAGSSLGALTYAQTRNDLVRIYTLTTLTGMDFRVATIPQCWPIHQDSMEFDQQKMRSLYQRGYQHAASNLAWADLPPVLDASELSTPRAGTEFFAPGK